MPRDLRIAFAQDWSPWFVLGVTLVVLLSVMFFYRRAAASVSRQYLSRLVIVRVIAMTALLLCLFRPVLSFQKTRLEQSVLFFLLDRSKSMSIHDFPNQPSRFDRARDALTDPRSRINDLLEDFNPQWCVFASHARRLERRKHLEKVEPDGEATDLATGIRDALALAEKKDIAGVVLLSDGINIPSVDPVAEIAAEGVPVYTVAVGTKLRQQPNYKDIAITKVDCSRTVPVHTTTRIRTFIEAVNYPDRVMPVILKENGKEIARTRVTLDNDQGDQEVVIEYTPKTKGDHEFQIVIPVDPSERIQENNTSTFPMLVTDPKIKVLYIEGVLRPEYREIRRALDFDPNVQYVSFIKTGPTRFNQQGHIKDIKLSGLPKDARTIARFDVIIVGSLERAHLAETQMTAIKNVVEKDGKGFMMLGGHHSYGPGGYAGTPIEEILPVYCGGLAQGQEREPFLPALTADGRMHPIFAGYTDFFDGLPAREDKARLTLLGCSIVPRVKPGASVLVENPQRKNENGHLVVIAVQRAGSGRAMASTVDSTWRWYRPLRGLGKESPFVRFWGQSVRWLAGSEEVRMAAGAVVMAWTDKHFYEPGASPTLYARVTDAHGQSTNYAAVTAAITRLKDRQQSDHQLAYTFGTHGEYEVTINPPEPGKYEVAVAASLEDKPLGSAKIKFRVGQPNKEFERLDLEDQLLKRIADRTSGRYYTLLSIEQLADTLRERAREKMIYSEIRLWNTPILFLGFVALFTGELILRKRRQLS